MIIEVLPQFATVSHGLPSSIGWWYFPTAILLGALHGLEPGHSKTMMAAFIVAVRGTVRQAVMLGLAATASHTLVIWVLAALTLYFKERIQAENTEAWLKAASGVMVIGLACWMGWRIHRDSKPFHPDQHGHGHDHGHEGEHDHGHGHHHHHGEAPAGHAHALAREHQDTDWSEVMATDDLHARAHAEDIRQRFAQRNVSTGQIIMFGLTGGLLPCPGALTVALLCLQTNRMALGFALVMAFSVGLALTLVTVGALAAWGARHASRRLKRFDSLIARLPYLSVAVLLVIGALLLWHGLQSFDSTSH